MLTENSYYPDLGSSGTFVFLGGGGRDALPNHYLFVLAVLSKALKLFFKQLAIKYLSLIF